MILKKFHKNKKLQCVFPLPRNSDKNGPVHQTIIYILFNNFDAILVFLNTILFYDTLCRVFLLSFYNDLCMRVHQGFHINFVQILGQGKALRLKFVKTLQHEIQKNLNNGKTEVALYLIILQYQPKFYKPEIQSEDEHKWKAQKQKKKAIDQLLREGWNPVPRKLTAAFY